MNNSKFLILKLGKIKLNMILDRQNANISALSSGELGKYEYLTGENLGCKPDVALEAKI